MGFVVNPEIRGKLGLIYILREYLKYFDLDVVRTKFARDSFGKSEIHGGEVRRFSLLGSMWEGLISVD